MQTNRIGKLFAGMAAATTLLATLSSPVSASVENEEPRGNICYSSGCTRDFASGREGAIGDFDGNGVADDFRVISDPNSSNNLLQIRYDNSGPWTTVNKTTAVRSQLRFADFDGDNKDDVFIKWPSGRWAYLSEGKGEWNFLSTSHHPIDRLRFRDIDGDGKDDVLGAYETELTGVIGFDDTVYKYYYVPTSGPGQWQPIPLEFR